MTHTFMDDPPPQPAAPPVAAARDADVDEAGAILLAPTAEAGTGRAPIPMMVGFKPRAATVAAAAAAAAAAALDDDVRCRPALTPAPAPAPAEPPLAARAASLLSMAR